MLDLANLDIQAVNTLLAFEHVVVLLPLIILYNLIMVTVAINWKTDGNPFYAFLFLYGFIDNILGIVCFVDFLNRLWVFGKPILDLSKWLLLGDGAVLTAIIAQFIASIIRVCAVYFPLKYKVFTMRRASILVCAIFITGFGQTTIIRLSSCCQQEQILTNGTYQYIYTTKIAEILNTFYGFKLIFLSFGALSMYILIILKMRHRARRYDRNQSTNNKIDDKSKKGVKKLKEANKERRIFVQAFSITIFYVIFISQWLAVTNGGKAYRPPTHILFHLHRLFICLHGSTVLSYIIFNRDLRRHLVRLVTCGKFAKQQETSIRANNSTSVKSRNEAGNSQL